MKGDRDPPSLSTDMPGTEAGDMPPTRILSCFLVADFDHHGLTVHLVNWKKKWVGVQVCGNSILEKKINKTSITIELQTY